MHATSIAIRKAIDDFHDSTTDSLAPGVTVKTALIQRLALVSIYVHNVEVRCDSGPGPWLRAMRSGWSMLKPNRCHNYELVSSRKAYVRDDGTGENDAAAVFRFIAAGSPDYVERLGFIDPNELRSMTGGRNLPRVSEWHQ